MWNKLGEFCSFMDLIREFLFIYLFMLILINVIYDLFVNLLVIKIKYIMIYSFFRLFMKEWELREMKNFELVSGRDKWVFILKVCWCFG